MPLVNRREFFAAAGGAASAALAAPAQRPNFVFLMADQFRADALGVSGNKFISTPNLDELARGGVRFANAYCPQALCTPSRASLMTGVYPHTHKLNHNVYSLPNAFKMPEFQLSPNWPVILREAGYYTGYIGKLHLAETDPGIFDFFSGYNSLMSHWMGERQKSEFRSDFETRQAMEFLEKHGSKPFVLFLSFYPPHNAAPPDGSHRGDYYDPPQKYEDKYRDKGIENPGYWGSVEAVDHAFGVLLAKLKELGLERDTFVSFTADHGETFGKRLGSVNKTVSYDDSARVPLLLRWPAGLPTGVVFEGGVTTLDLMPTMLEAAGLPIPHRVQGLSRLHEIRRHDMGWKAPVFLENITQLKVGDQYAIERAVRTKDWKLILRDHPKDELYDLVHDPQERTDLMNQPEQKARIREMSQLILRWSEETGDPVGGRLAKRYA
jgi:arylsulfatase A-like enzyme